MEQLSLLNIETQFVEIASQHLLARKSDNPEFKAKFIKVFSDMVFSQTADGLEKLKKSNPNSLLNAIFKATESGASFAKKEIHVLPFEIFDVIKNGDITQKKATGTYDLTIIVDINFQKQQILKMPNCKKFFTAEVHEGVVIIHDLTTGNRIFEGVNDVTKPTIGYYAVFLTTDGELYDEFMTCAEIIDRAKLNKVGFKENNYVNTKKSPHYEKIVVRNLLKAIPKLTEELQSVLAVDEIEDAHYEDVTNQGELLPAKKTLEEAKKELSVPPTTTNASKAADFLNNGGVEFFVAEDPTAPAETTDWL